MAPARSLCDAPIMPMLTSLQLESLPRGQPNACPTATDRVSHQACYTHIQFSLSTDTGLSLRKHKCQDEAEILVVGCQGTLLFPLQSRVVSETDR